ncbi:MAG: 2-C-methyl-D-erythritol 4-phosphate cytidylyltransferase [Candidatus Hydrogenedentota bacterium]
MIVAGGMGTRLGHPQPKALVTIAGDVMLRRTFARFHDAGLTERALVTLPAGFEHAFREALAPYESCAIQLVPGGKERQNSVANGLSKLDPDTDIVVIHDAARPFVAVESIQASVDAAAEFGAATVAIPSIDTILVSDSNTFLVDTPDRATLWACQTPQTFRLNVIREAHEAARRDGFLGTDDGSLVRRNGGRVKLVMGSPLNFKITTPADLALAEAVVERGLA